MASTRSQKKKEPLKRKIIDEGRLFSEKWTDDYFFFFEPNSKALCLIYREFVQVFKDYNLKRHYMQKYAAKFNAYKGLCHKDHIVELKKYLSSQKKILKKLQLGRIPL